VSVHGLASHSLARAIFITWAAGVPALAFGLASQRAAIVSAAAAVMFIGVLFNAAQLAWTYRRSRESGARIR
jgi:hypothetical protein